MKKHNTVSAYNQLSYDEQLKAIWKYTQRGLVYPSPKAIFGLAWLQENTVSTAYIKNILLKIREYIHTTSSLKNANTTIIVGLDLHLWQSIREKEKEHIPNGIKLRFPSDKPGVSKVFERSRGTYQHSGADLWLHIKSDNEEACDQVLEAVKNLLKKDLVKIEHQKAASKSNREDGKKGKVLGDRFSENLNNPADPVSIKKHIITGDEDIESIGGCCVVAQRFQINWDQIHSMSETQIEDIIGRKTNDTIIPNRDTRTHIKSSRMQNEFGDTTPILRLGLPFGKSAFAGCPHLLQKGSNLGDEQGIFFAGYAKRVDVLETIMNNQIGDVDGYMNDRTFNHIKSDMGGYFYVPGLPELGINEESDYHSETNLRNLEIGNWDRFPGVNWSRLDRHFEQASENGLMFYNHKNYLYTMATMSDEERKTHNPPSARILYLLENSFMRWQDNWYIDRKQEEMGHIVDYLKDYKGNDAPKDIMKLSIMERKGWAIRLTLHLLASDGYGFRGRRVFEPFKKEKKFCASDYQFRWQSLNKHGKITPYYGQKVSEYGSIFQGADTYRIDPLEIIVGAMPNLSLGQGRYFIRYLSEDESMDGFLKGLSEASGVGHNIPDYEKLLTKGLGGLMDDVEQKLTNSNLTQEVKEFYNSVLISLKGVSEYCQFYADLATEMIKTLGPNQRKEEANLKAISARMMLLSTEAPSNFIEAAQLVFTYHSCLHQNGEPTAIGRLDQLLQPFLDKDNISSDYAQEIIDAFFIKLDEKVQQNRLFVEDHQYYGNLAMGGSSGPYPQGGAVNQWIQQVTVGGTLANEETGDGTPAYNEVTKLCLKASGRLPLNAPCLSLRVREDIPEEICEEAAKTILSGGAHPILLSDKVFIEGLRMSGDGVGGKEINEKYKNIWDSRVSLKSARNYACDGCYEPQFVGENWFTLGGLSTLDPLECALNKGKTYISAGPGYFRGQVKSFTSKDPSLIDSFEELEDLFFQHFKHLNIKGINSQLSTYGANTSICPAPLLSVLINDCIEKGLDYYSGGAKYNIWGPCYIGLSTTINSLYAIKKMVYDEASAITSLPELVDCLSCNWGNDMNEPFVSSLAGEQRISEKADRYKRLREKALSMPKYGRGHQEINEYGDKILQKIARISVETFTNPIPQIESKIEALIKQYGSENFKFGIQIQPGVGTFENHVEMGAWNGASADGRLKGATIASDLSPAPSPSDKAPNHQYSDFSGSLAGYGGKGTQAYTDGAPTDFNIPENYPLEGVKEIIKQVGRGESSNILTITVSNPQTMSEAVDSPEKYDLLRVRTGGWSEFFTAMFPDKQAQHLRRPISIKD